MIYRFDGREPVIATGTYVSETAILIGDVRIATGCYIGHGAILRGDYGAIVVGNDSAIEEGVIVHAPPQESCEIGDGVVIGHGAIVHSRCLAEWAGVGMGATLSIHSEVGRSSVVAEGAVVKQGQVVADSIVVAGNPARKIKDMTQKDLDFWARSRKTYSDLARKYCALGMERIG
jgi:carbonic anhydrase/acetyltransferase-like protein (isoleucine patch superfamily)